MISILAKRFIKNHNEYGNPDTRQAYGMLCGAVGIGLNFLLFAGKFFAGIISGSIAITADAFNNLSDAGSSFITLIGFKLAGQEPDPEHPFGHGRLEYVSGLVVAGAILLMAYELVTTSIDKIRHPEATMLNIMVGVILIASILVKLYMASYNFSIGKKIDSASMKATGTDSLSDMVSTTVVLASNLLGHLLDIQIDGYCGLLVGILILIAGINAAKDTINPLLGQAPEKEFVDKIEELVMNTDGILGMHDLIVHNYGPGRVIISLHAEVPANGDILEMHDMIDLLEWELKKQLRCEAVIHMDPIVTDDAELNMMKEHIYRIILNIDDSLHMHDFRMVKGPTHTNIIFDVVVPYNFRMSSTELVDLIQKKVWEIDKKYMIVVNVDHSYV